MRAYFDFYFRIPLILRSIITNIHPFATFPCVAVEQSTATTRRFRSNAFPPFLIMPTRFFNLGIDAASDYFSGFLLPEIQFFTDADNESGINNGRIDLLIERLHFAHHSLGFTHVSNRLTTGRAKVGRTSEIIVVSPS